MASPVRSPRQVAAATGVAMEKRNGVAESFVVQHVHADEDMAHFN
jgi:hypothetical protein